MRLRLPARRQTRLGPVIVGLTPARGGSLIANGQQLLAVYGEDVGGEGEENRRPANQLSDE